LRAARNDDIGRKKGRKKKERTGRKKEKKKEGINSTRRSSSIMPDTGVRREMRDKLLIVMRDIT